MTSIFDEEINRYGTHSKKWDEMSELFDVPEKDGLAMWVADMDFRAPQCIQDALRQAVDHGIYGYFGDEKDYLDAIAWWMETRHGWRIDPSWISTTHGLVNGTALCVDAFSSPGDGVVLFTPVYHAFSRVIRAAGRTVVECPLVLSDGRYEMDFDRYDELMTGKEKIVILCSPHNPGGRVWTKSELRDVAEFARRHDLVLVSDEIHHDLVLPGAKHIPMSLADDDIADRLVMMTATTKTFNIAGSHTGNVIIADDNLRKRFQARLGALGLAPNSFGLLMATAAYSPDGAQWVDDLCLYLDGNRQVFDAAVNSVPGLRSMALEATYLAWVDFSDTGLDQATISERTAKRARIAANQGPSFGTGGESFQRFNLAMPRAQVAEAADRLRLAFLSN